MEALLPYFIDIEQDIEKAKDPARALVFWTNLAFQIETCDEADMMFPEMLMCPVCMARSKRDQDGVWVEHREVLGN